ncbi:PaaI family thioesterase [Nocardioides immobilis]|nr:PaaI family thioesterase [Nocardioides immobilis]
MSKRMPADDLPPPVYLCGGCRRTGRCRFGIESEHLDDAGVVTYRLRCDRVHEGGLNVAHGGWTAGVLDELVGHVAVLSGQLAVTGQLDVRFVKPVPVDQPLVARAWRESQQGSRWYVRAVLHLEAGGAELATANGILVERDHGHFSRHQEWLQEQLAEADDGAA